MTTTRTTTTTTDADDDGRRRRRRRRERKRSGQPRAGFLHSPVGGRGPLQGPKLGLDPRQLRGHRGVRGHLLLQCPHIRLHRPQRLERSVRDVRVQHRA
jgi:hypothetical protein